VFAKNCKKKKELISVKLLFIAEFYSWFSLRVKQMFTIFAASEVLFKAYI